MKLINKIFMIMISLILLNPEQITAKEISTIPNQIKSLIIEDTNLNYEVGKTNYEINIPYHQNQLNIKIILENENYYYKIYNNENLKDNDTIIIRIFDQKNNYIDYEIKIKKEYPYSIIIIITLILTYLITYLTYRILKRRSENPIVKIV